MLKSTYMQPPDVIDPTRPAHLEFLKAEIDAGRLLLAGRQEDGSGGMLITADISAEDAQDIVDRTPTRGPGWRATSGRRFNGAYRAPGL